MLLNLCIKNLAVFGDVSVDFSKGFNVITGETGAGKSVLIEALFLVCGQKASKEFIRRGKNSAFVSAAFNVGEDSRIKEILNRNSVIIDDEDCLIISRELLNTGKSINRINGIIVTSGLLREIGPFLIDIYGQFEQQYVYKKENHISILDEVIGEKINLLLIEYRKLYKNYLSKQREFEEIKLKLVNKDQKIEQCVFEMEEIDSANLTDCEEDKLLKELKKMSNIKEMKSFLYDAEGTLIKNEVSAVGLINVAFSNINKIINFDDGLKVFCDKLSVICEELQDISFEIINYTDNLDIDDFALEELENRIAHINKLKRKYGFSIEKIHEYREELEKEYQILQEADRLCKELDGQVKDLTEKLNIIANKLSLYRKEAAEFLENSIVGELEDLNMKHTKFKVNFILKDEFSENGLDEVEFLMSTNMGTVLNPIHKILSGGEASRLMLAFKKLSCDKEKISTVIFDEIDTGISGKTAQMAGNKMKFISENTQVICVTHSPQISSISNEHFVIEKTQKNGETFSYIKKITYDEKVNEIARLLSGLNITKESLENAKDLIDSNK